MLTTILIIAGVFAAVAVACTIAAIRLEPWKGKTLASGSGQD